MRQSPWALFPSLLRQSQWCPLYRLLLLQKSPTLSNRVFLFQFLKSNHRCSHNHNSNHNRNHSCSLSSR